MSYWDLFVYALMGASFSYAWWTSDTRSTEYMVRQLYRGITFALVVLCVAAFWTEISK